MHDNNAQGDMQGKSRSQFTHDTPTKKPAIAIRPYNIRSYAVAPCPMSVSVEQY